jgi:hypothetical protein
VCQGTRGCLQRGRNNRQSLPWGLLFFRSPDVCGQTDQGSWILLERTHVNLSNEEANSLYLCTVRDYHALHKWDAGGTPSKAMELQEMVVDGQGNRETRGSTSDRIFFIKYPMPFLQHWYGTFPPAQQDTTTTGTSDVSPPSVGVHADTAGERRSGGTQSKFPHLPPSKDVVFKYWTLVSDDLIPHGRNSGQYTATFN